MQEKRRSRRELRDARRAFVATLPDAVRSLVFSRPPQEIAEFLADRPTLGFYHPVGDEAPSLGWVRWFHEQGHRIALPRLEAPGESMQFRLWAHPWDDSELELGLHGIRQPNSAAERVRPDALIVPLVGFTEDCQRLGQGGGHYDRWLEANREVATIGLGWDVQRVDNIPAERHDRQLDAVATPTRVYWSGR